MIRMTVLVWLLLFVLLAVPLTLALAGLIPRWVCWGCSTAFFTSLVPLVVWSNRRQERIQSEDGMCPVRGYSPVRMTRHGVYAAFGGGIFGGTAWLLIMAAIVKDWASFGVVLGCAFLLFVVATVLVRRDARRYWSVALMMVCTLMAVTLAVVNLRWSVWMPAYRQSAAYDPRNDVSLMTINAAVLAALAILLATFAIRHVRSRGAHRHHTSNARE